MTSPRVRQLPNCQGEEPNLLPVATAYQRIFDALVPVTETVTIGLEMALDRVLGQTVTSPIDVPPHRNSAMDGYALAGTDIPNGTVGKLRIIGSAWAGRPFTGTVARGQAVRIMTGAHMPQGTDTVIMQEQAEIAGDYVRIDGTHRPGQNVREAGEDLKKNADILHPGQRIGPAEMGLLASLGITHIDVLRPLRAAIFSTGDEVKDIGEPLTAGAIYDTNRYTLRGMLERARVEFKDMGVLPDDPQRIATALSAAAGKADVLITSGGVSAGAADHIANILHDLGQIGFWKIAIRPGRPLAFGSIGDAAFFGLPGNPVAVMVTFYQFALPALRLLAGEVRTKPEPTIDAVCTAALRKKAGRVEYYRALLQRGANGQLTVRPTGATGSGLLHTMSEANCFIILGHDDGDVNAGETVPVQPFYGLT